MPTIVTHLDALAHNHRLVTRLGKAWGFTLLPVLKMVGCHPTVTRFLHEAGHSGFGAADVDEPVMFAPQSEGDKVLINIPPLGRARDVVRAFRRSAVSSLEGILALEAAARELRLVHSALLMVDIGDLREGIPPEDVAPLLETLNRENLEYVRLIGIGVNMGCLHGACPDDRNMALLRRTADGVEAALNRPLDVISLGGSIFFEWFSRQGRSFRLSPGCVLELRAGDPLLLGYDIYRNIDFPGGVFRRDVFSLEATVLELREKNMVPPRESVLNGQGRKSRMRSQGRRWRVLLDCGSLHTDVQALELDLPGAEIVGFSGNYSILDVTRCPERPKVGDTVAFRPRYWAVARAFRTPLVTKRFEE